MSTKAGLESGERGRIPPVGSRRSCIRCRMSPARKMELLVQMYHTGIALKVAGLRLQHPDWTEQQLTREARRRAMYART